MERLYKIFRKGIEIMSNMICTSECVKCTHCELNDSNKANIRIHCKLKEKEYCYGQKIPCENYTKKE